MLKIKYRGKEIELNEYIVLMLDKGYSDIIEEIELPDGTIKGKWKNFITSENILISKDNIDSYKEIIESNKDKVKDYKDYIDAIEPPKVLSNNKVKKSKKSVKKKKEIVQEEQQEIDFSNLEQLDELNALLKMQNNISYEQQQSEEVSEEERNEIRRSIAKQLTEGTYFQSQENNTPDNAFEARKQRSKSGKNRMNFEYNAIEDLEKEKIENQYNGKTEEEVIRIKRNKNQVLNQMFQK